MSRYIETRGESRAPGRCALPHVAAAAVGRHADAIVACDHEGAAHGAGLPRAARDHRAAEAVFEFVSFDRDTAAASVSCCARPARMRARCAARYLRAVGNPQFHLARRAHVQVRGAARVDIGHFVEWVKERSHLTRGVTVGTMMRDEAFHFTRIGTFSSAPTAPRAFSTAHQSDLDARRRCERRAADPYEWSVLLRALSAFEVYRRVYRDVITPLQGGADSDPARRHAALAAALLQGGVPT